MDIKSEQWLRIFHFFRVLTLFMIFKWWVHNHTRRASFGTPTSWLTMYFWVILLRTMHFNISPFWSCLINCSIPKRGQFMFEIISSNASKTRASGFHVIESNVARVVAMNWRCIYSWLLYCCSCTIWCSGYNEKIPPGIILVEVKSPNHSL